MSNFANPELTNNFRQIILASNTPASPAIVFANDLTKGLYWDIDGLHLTGLSATPTDNTEAASKAYVDAQGGGGVTYPLLAPDGTSGAPSYSFASNNALGMFLDGSGQINLNSTNGIVMIPSAGGALITSSAGQGILIEADNSSGSFLLINPLTGFNANQIDMNLATGGIFTVTDNSSGNIGLEVDKSTTAGNTRMLLWDVDKGALSRVSVGAADSGGTGFKLLRVPN